MNIIEGQAPTCSNSSSNGNHSDLSRRQATMKAVVDIAGVGQRLRLSIDRIIFIRVLVSLVRRILLLAVVVTTILRHCEGQ